MRLAVWRASCAAVLVPLLAGQVLAQTPAGAPATAPAPDPAVVAASLAASCGVEDSAPAFGAGRGGAAGAGRGGLLGAAGAGNGGGPAAGAGRAGAPPGAAPAAARAPTPPPLRPISNSAPISTRDLSGFTELFDGRDLSGWQGDAKYWSVVDGVLTGQSGAEDTRATDYLVWRGGTLKDFDLIFTYRLNVNGDSGIQYRNQEVAVANDPLRGPAFDLGGRDDSFTGNIFEEQGPSFLANHGFFAWETPAGRQNIADVASIEAARACVHPGDWNTGEVIARGDTMIHILNGHVVGVFIDQNPNRLQSGVLGIQLHTGTVGKVEFKSIKLKTL